MTTSNEDEQATAQTFETITMHSDKNPVVSTFTQPIPMANTLMRAAEDGQDHTLKDFFMRPIIIARGSWSITDAAASLLTTQTLPNVFLTQSMITNKVKGFLGFKGTAIVRLQVNTNRFQMGRLFLNFIPESTQRVNKTYTTNQSLVFQSQLPRSDFDAATDTETVLEIPYINTDLMFNLRSGDGVMGVVNIVVYEPLQASTGETTADWTLWCSFKDVSLEFPTIPSGFITQAGPVATRRKKKYTDSELEQNQTGPISSVFSKISAAANILTDVPFLSSFAAPTAWFTAASAKAASAFGFSNPINIKQQCVVVQQAMSRSINDTGLDNSINLGLHENNCVATLPGFAGLDTDEMSLQHILSIPTFFFRQVWSDTNVAGDNLVTLSLCPATFFSPGVAYQYDTTPGHTVASIYPTPVNYFSWMFKYYHGSIRVTVKVVKTEFHSGRLLIGYSPCDSTDPSITNNDMNYVHREIIDLRYSNEITLTFPFASTIPWRACDSPYGNVYINVENDLRHPDTVPSSVTLLLEVSAAPDFKFALPRPLTMYPVYLRTAPGGEFFSTQAGVTTVVKKEGNSQVDTTMGNIGSSVLTSDADSAALYCIGESIQSLRQVLKRSNLFYVPSTSTPSSSISPYTYVIHTQYFGWNTDAAPDYFGFIMTTFNYWRGAMRMRLYEYDYDNGTPRLTLIQEGDTKQILAWETGSGSFQLAAAYPIVVGNLNTYPFIEIQVPFYSHTSQAISSANSVTTSNVLVNETTKNPHQYVFAISPTNIENSRFTRQIADDFSAGFFVGTQPLIPITTTTFPSIARV